jgi:parallel beta-helix repeat protein
MKLSVSLASLLALAVWATALSSASAATLHCGDLITESTTLDADVVGPNCGLRITGHDLTLDLNGHRVTGVIGNFNPAALEGQPGAVPADNNVIKDGLADGVGAGFSHNVTIEGMTVGARGISYSRSDGTVVRNHVNSISRPVGISLIEGALVVSDNVVVGVAGPGIEIDHGVGVVLKNVLTDNGGGIHFSFSSGRAERNVIRNNAETGIASEFSGISLVDNDISRNGGDGVVLSSQGAGSISENRITRNGGDGIRTDTENTTIIDNRTWWNGKLGIDALAGVSGAGNSAKHNGDVIQCVPAFLCNGRAKSKTKA